MFWTKELPKEPGFYFFRNPKFRAGFRVYRVVDNAGMLAIETDGIRIFVDLMPDGGEWCLIEEPKEGESR